MQGLLLFLNGHGFRSDCAHGTFTVAVIVVVSVKPTILNGASLPIPKSQPMFSCSCSCAQAPAYATVLQADVGVVVVVVAADCCGCTCSC